MFIPNCRLLPCVSSRSRPPGDMRQTKQLLPSPQVRRSDSRDSPTPCPLHNTAQQIPMLRLQTPLLVPNLHLCCVSCRNTQGFLRIFFFSRQMVRGAIAPPSRKGKSLESCRRTQEPLALPARHAGRKRPRAALQVLMLRLPRRPPPGQDAAQCNLQRSSGTRVQ